MNERVGLGLSTASDATFASFFVGVNEQTLQRIQHGDRIWLHGDRAVGKTHVLQSLARECASSQLLECKLPDLDSDLTEELLLIDDFDALCNNEENEYALFAAYEATDFTVARWVVSARRVPQEISFLYRDLASRMALFERVELLPVPDAHRGELLKFWANDRAIGISDEVVTYLLDRIPRTQEHLWDTLQTLERATLIDARPLTIPFVRQALGFDKT